MYGAQTSTNAENAVSLFENDVEMYGAQTSAITASTENSFENDVEMYGAQTISLGFLNVCGLRMM